MLATLEEASTAFAWSPDSQKIAYIASDTIRSQGAAGVLRILDIERPAKPLVTTEDELVVMFFWSPDSKKIAYFTAEPITVEDEEGQDRQVLAMALKRLTVSSGDVETLLPLFQPTAELISVVPYFDQYHHSATIWSPDSQNVVVAAYREDDTPEIWVINASGNLQPRYIADGRLAFWSWE
jgi:Tol biopolymer transport system component